jgi:hypothetical protein
MAMTQQQIYEEALRRAGIMTSATPLTVPGLPVSYSRYVSLISTPSGSAQVRRLIPYSQLARFEAEMHNINSEQKHKQFVSAAKAESLRKIRAEFEAMNSAEIALFKEFKLAQEAKKQEEEAATARKAAEEAAAREQEITSATQLFREMLNDWLKTLYSQPDNEILRVGTVLKESGPGGLEWPHAFKKMWREKRYKGKIEWHNYSHSICDGGWSPAKNGREWDGWPLLDEADAEVHKILNEEWKSYLNFCLRFAERS